MGGELLIGFQDVVFLPSRACFYTTFLTNCGGSESLKFTTCPMTVVGGEQGHAPSKIFLLQQSFFLCQSNFMEIIWLIQR